MGRNIGLSGVYAGHSLSRLAVLLERRVFHSLTFLSAIFALIFVLISSLRILQVMARLPSRLLGASSAAASTSFSALSAASRSFSSSSSSTSGLLQRRFMSGDGAAPKTAGVWAPPPRPTPGQGGYETMNKVHTEPLFLAEIGAIIGIQAIANHCNIHLSLHKTSNVDCFQEKMLNIAFIGLRIHAPSSDCGD